MENYNETIFFDDISNIKTSPDAYQSFTTSYQNRHNDKSAPDHIPVVVIISVRRKITFTSKGDHNYLRHFRKIYAAQGWITVQCTPAEERILNGESDQVAASLLFCLERRGLSTNPLVLHLLGHQAVPVYNAITAATGNERGDLFQIKGCIVDSGPVRPTGFMSYLRKQFPTIYTVLMMILWLLASVFPEVLPRPDEFDEYDKFCYHTGGWPQLFLYSSTDHLVKVDDVERVMSIRHRAGVPVDAKCWHDTEHARHLFTHEDEYTHLCQVFARKVISL